MFDESLGLTVRAENDCDEYEDGQKQFLAQFVAAKPGCGGLLNTKANFDCGKSRVTTLLLARQSRVLEGTKPKQSFSLTVDIFGQSHKVQVKAARCGADDRVVQTCLSTLDHAESCLIHVSPRQSLSHQPFGLAPHSLRLQVFAPGCK